MNTVQNFHFVHTTKDEIKAGTEVEHMNYETIMSFIELPPGPDVELDASKLACFNVSFTSRRKSDKF